MKPRRIDAATRASLSLLTRLCDWRSCLIVVRPEALVRGHRAGRRQQWRYLSRPGRPPIPLELRQLVRRLTAQNGLLARSGLPIELLPKLSFRVSPRTVREHMPEQPPSCPRGDRRWSTLFKSHATAIAACDFFVAVTATFPQFYIFVLIEHGSRRLLHLNVTEPPGPSGRCRNVGKFRDPSIFDISSMIAIIFSPGA